MGDLAECVHTGIRSPGHHEVRWRAVPGEDGGEPRLELPLHGTETGLRRPAGERGAVVGDVEPVAQERLRPVGCLRARLPGRLLGLLLGRLLGLLIGRLPGLLLAGLLVRYHAAESRRGPIRRPVGP